MPAQNAQWVYRLGVAQLEKPSTERGVGECTATGECIRL
jgi:hypothetical protein